MKSPFRVPLPLLSIFRPTAALLRAAGLLFACASAFAQTAADILGPDGIVYPDFRSAGVPGGIPSPTVRRDISFYSYYQTDTAQAIEDAAAYAASLGGGVVTIPGGTFYLHRPAIISASNVVLRGNGAGGSNPTRIYFDYSSGPGNKDIIWYRPGPGATSTTLYPNTWVEAHADRKPSDGTNLQWLEITNSAGTQIASSYSASDPIDNSWGSFSVTTSGNTVKSITGAGTNITLIAKAHYSDGTVVSKSLVVTVVASGGPALYVTPGQGAIAFMGNGAAGASNINLASDAARGSTTLTLVSTPTVAANDYLEVIARGTAAWNASLGNLCPTDLMRRYIFKVASVSGNQVTLTQPLRIDFPATDASMPTGGVTYVHKFNPLVGGGVENLYLEQTKNIWITGITFNNAVGCWVKGVTVKKAGRHPVYTSRAKWCEIRDCTFDDAWWKGGGGSAYVGYDYTYDSLMENVTSTRLRHGPLVQWSAAGNVIRNSYFESDAQWHAGWSNENLFEKNTILPATDNGSGMGNGAYGFGMISTAPEDAEHGPNGPRNVVYNNDVSSEISAVWLGGQNRGWRFVSNRFSSTYGGNNTSSYEPDHTGTGIYAKSASTDHIIHNNVFALKHGITGIWTKTSDTTGIQVTDNQFISPFSNTSDVGGGAVPLALDDGNTLTDTLDKTLWTFNNPGFELGTLTYWDASADPAGVSTVTSAAARNGSAAGLNVTAPSSGSGSSVYSQAFTVTPGHGYLARFWARVNSGGSNLGVYLKFYTSGGGDAGSVYVAPNASGIWAHYDVQGVASATAVTAKIWIHSFSNKACSIDFDDFAFGEVPFTVGDPGFESGSFAIDDAHWDNSGDNAMSSIVSITDGHNPGTTKVLRVTDNSTTLSSSVATRRFDVTPGLTYEGRFWARVTSAVNGIGVYLRFYNAAGTLIDITPAGFRDIPLTPNPNTAELWRQQVVRAVAPAGAAKVCLWVHSYSTATGVTAEFDDFVLSEIPLGPTPLVASIYDWQRNPQYPLANAGFESGSLSDWITTEDTASSKSSYNTVIATDAHTGTRCLLVTDTDATWGSTLATAHWPVAPGKTYKASFWARMVSGSGGISVYIRYFDASNNRITTADTSVAVPAGATSWTQYNLTSATAPANAVTAEVWIHSYAASASVNCKFDDFTFTANL
jgi:hypothetical protein